MKHLLFSLLFAALCSSAFAQLSTDSTTHKISISRVIDFPGYSKDSLFSRSCQFLKSNAQLLLFMNDYAHKDPKWSVGRAKWSDKDYAAPGYYSEIRDKNIVVGKAVFIYKGAREGCIQFLTITADVVIMNKQEKTRIEFTNFVYTHKNIGAPPIYMDLGTMGTLTGDNAGTLEKMFESKACPKVFEAVGNFINKNANDFMDVFSKDFKGAPIKDSTEKQFENAYNKEW